MVTKADRGCHEPRDAGNHQELGEARKDSPLGPLEGAKPSRHLDFALVDLRTISGLYHLKVHPNHI